MGLPVESAGQREPSAGTAGTVRRAGPAGEPDAQQQLTGHPAGRFRMLALSSAAGGGPRC